MYRTRRNIVSATFWSSFGVVGSQGIAFLVGLWLARILDPSDFGRLAMLMVFLGAGHIGVNLGLRAALIHDTQATQEDLSSTFYVNLALGLTLSLLLFACSGPIAAFYNEPELVSLARALSPLFLISSVASIQRTLLLKQLEMRTESFVLLCSSIVSGIVAVYLALQGFGTMALVAKLLVEAATDSLLLWWVSSWRPSLAFRIASLRKYKGFTLNMIGAKLITSLTGNFDSLVAGRIFAAVDVGILERARSANLFAQSLSWSVLNKVVFPVLARLQDEPEKFLGAYRKFFRLTAFLVIPTFVGLAVLAEPLVIVLVTEKWLASALLLQILALASFLTPLLAVASQGLMARGMPGKIFQLNAWKALFFVTGVLLGAFWKLEGIAVGIACSHYLVFLMHAIVIRNVLRIGLLEQLRDLVVSLAAALLMGALLVVVRWQLDLAPVFELILIPVVGAAFYLPFTLLLDRPLRRDVNGLLGLRH